MRTSSKTVRNLSSIRLSGRDPVLLIAGLVLYIVLLLLIARVDWVGHIGDDASYVGAAKGLSQWAGYAEFERPDVRPETKHPPGYPLLILPMFWLGFGQIAGFQFVTALFGFGSLLLLSRYQGPTGLFLAILTALNFYWLLFCQHLLSEIPYGFALLLICWLVRRCESEGKVSMKHRLILACTLGFSVLLRTIGVILIPLLLFVLWRKKIPIRQWILVPVYAVLMIAPFYLYSAISGYRDDVTGYPGVLTVLETNVSYYLEALPFLMGVTVNPASLSDSVGGFICILLLVLTCWSGWAAFREGLELEVLAVFGFAAVLLVWPFQDPRLFVPLIPLMLLLVLRGGGSILNQIGLPKPYHVAFGVFLIAESVRMYGPLTQALQSKPPHARPPILSVIDQLAEPGDVVVADDPGVWLQCGTPIFPLAPEGRILKLYEAWIESMAMVDARFLLLAKNLDHGRSLSMGETRSSADSRLMQTVLNLTDSFKKVGEDERYVLFEIIADSKTERLAAGWFRLGHQKFFDRQGGAEEFEKALAVNPAFPVARFFLANLLLQQGRTSEAVEQLEILLRYQPFFEDAKALLLQLRGSRSD